MLYPKLFFELLRKQGIVFFAGVPDSILKSFSAYVTDHAAKGNHVICANEGNAIGLAIGYHLATKKVALTYLQNSGLGNVINPLLSLADSEVYSVPVLIVVGWRGEPGVKDEPQHKKQGRVMLAMLDAMEIPYRIMPRDHKAADNTIQEAINYMKENGAPFALIVREGTFDSYTLKDVQKQSIPLTREDAIKLIIDSLEDEDIVVSTTGMSSREVFEYREELNQGHGRDFLTVGGMGHASQIALGIANQKPNRKVLCLDGDGAAIMHMGAMAINGVQNCENFIHIVLNNGAHASVGGQPTVGFDISFKEVARAVKYKTILGAETSEEIIQGIAMLKKKKGPAFLEIRVNKGYRKDLGRPTITPAENKNAFMEFLG
ncbi:phosphonopyruvate decarboxylase [Chloroflexota bacterium]